MVLQFVYVCFFLYATVYSGTVSRPILNGVKSGKVFSSFKDLSHIFHLYFKLHKDWRDDFSYTFDIRTTA